MRLQLTADAAICQDSGYSIDLAWCVMGFFLLSFAFQLAVSLMSTCRSGYSNIFQSQEPDDETYESRFAGKILDSTSGVGRVDPKYFADVTRWCSDMLAFNSLRFVEYTFSGSLVLVTIGMIAGIIDVELLACMFLLSASCMMMGLVAEYCMRGRVALKAIERNLPGSDFEKLTYVFHIIRAQLAYAFWISHILAWVCILLPW